MSMICVLKQASDDSIDRLLADPELIIRFLHGDEALFETNASSGFFARLFGTKKPIPPPVTEPVPSPFESDMKEIDLDKSWHGIHFLLTGSDWEGNFPEGFLLKGGATIGEIDVGYGPARAYTAQQTVEINRALTKLDADSLQQRFQPAEMMRQLIYPEIWDCDPEEDDTLGYLLAYFEDLKQFLAETAERGFGMIVYIG